MVIYITANDTEIGKTFVTSLILNSLSKKNKRSKIAMIKPIESGVINYKNSDLGIINNNNKNLKNIDYFNFYSFKEPISPYTASLIENKKINYKSLIKKISLINEEYDITIVEGAGGLMVPITRNKKIIDMIKDLNSHCYLIVNPNLGTINHTYLSIQSIKEYKIKFNGIIINSYPKNPGISEIYNPIFFSNNKIKIQGVIPRIKKTQINEIHLKSSNYLSNILGGKFNENLFIKSCNKLFKTRHL